MNWWNDYQRKRVTAEEAVSVITSGNRLYVSGNAATPYVLLSALAARRDELRGISVTSALLLGNDPLSQPGMEEHFRLNSLFVGPADRAAVNEGRADYVPIFLHEIPELFLSGQMPLDVALIQTSPPDEHGFLSLGVECLMTMAAITAARTVIAQVNDRMPRTMGDCYVHVSRVSRIVEVSCDLPELERSGMTEVERKIGEYIAELIEDGSTLQLGIGGIPDAVLASLQGKRDLGIHTEMISDGVMEAIEAGIITGARKTLHPRKVVCTFALGSRRLYEYLHNNPLFEFHPANYTNDPFVIAQNDKMVAVNSAIEVDLTGQVCADSIGTMIYSGVGGQVDFIRGAARSRGGKPIIALPSTARGGTVSRIVPVLRPGAGVVTTRADVHYVVTEYGIAYLHGKNLRERAEALIRIAHPQFREELLRAARERRLGL
ncbi:MAG TPA: acetyl-CoA hydrolase/transferase C-terminal domain-containing protein [Blastocatellia bacterium]|nr:acetyl-CoA hydrolase/transferase C-terminal domain-containing protein [Blastocatellia bacterium]